jgi:glycerol-3-phosphate dehydrogenase (NAD(P)+)
MKAAVLGAGSWGTTFAQVLCDAGTDTVLYARKPQLAKAIAGLHENPDYLPGVALTPALEATADPAEALDGADLVAFAVPAQSLRSNLADWAPLIPPGALLVSLMKGIELGTRLRMSEVIAEVTGPELAGPGAERIAVVAGPNLAGEIVRREITAAVVACSAESGALALQAACHTPYFRPYTNTDVTGCELGGAVKNVIAIAVGIAVAMGLGDNTRATLITRGLAEIARLGSALGAQTQTFAGLAGMGDLVATCSSPLSRNRTFGEYLGRGMSVESASAAMNQTAEGVTSSGPVLALARAHQVEMPITEVVEAVMRDGLPVAQAASMLASRSAKPEWYGP